MKINEIKHRLIKLIGPKPFASIYLVSTYFSTYLPMYKTYIFPTEWVTKVKPNINSVEVHPQLRNNGHPVENGKIRV